MSGFSEQLMRDRLQKLTNTAHSIQTMSVWLLHHSRKYADTILDCWLKEVRNNSDSERLISLINLANDLIQNSRRKGPAFMSAFYEVLQPAFIHAIECMGDPHRKMLERIISVWRDRQIYSARQLDDLAKCLIDDREAISPNLKSDAESPSKSSPDARQQSPADNGTAVDDEFKTVKEESQFRKEVFSTFSANMISMLRKLEDPASADVKIRQIIAAYPESIAIPAHLKELKSTEELTALLDKIAEATPVVEVYCSRLREEMKDREKFQFLLEDYIKALNEACERNRQMLVSVKKRIARLDEEKKELARHIDSLPDLAEMFGAEPASMPQLPSLGELFTSTH